MPDIVIDISADGSGNFTYSPSTAAVKPGDTITWTSGKGPFAISFMDRSPFGEMSFSSHSEAGAYKTYPRTVGKSHGHHHYSVAIAVFNPEDRTDFQISLDAGCPDIVVSS